MDINSIKKQILEDARNIRPSRPLSDKSRQELGARLGAMIQAAEAAKHVVQQPIAPMRSEPFLVQPEAMNTAKHRG